MTTPKTVIFDLGKVLVDFDYGIAAGRIAARSSIDAEEIKRFINQSALLYRYETGLLSSEEFYREVCQATGFRGELEEFGLLFGDIFSPVQPMIELQADLRQRGIPTFIFSNTNHLAVTHLRRQFPFFNLFDGYILSYEQRLMKPDARIYQVVERLSGRSKADLLYVDDRPENTETGIGRGWQVITHESPEKTLTAVRNLGL